MSLDGYSVLLDLDGTLIDTAPDLTATLNTILTARGQPAIAERELKPLVGRGARLMIERALRIHGIEVEPAELEQLFHSYLDEYETRLTRLSRPFDGAEAALDRLADDGVLLAVCTNKPERLAVKLFAELGLKDRFRRIAGPETFGAAKPNPLHLTRTIESIGGTRDRALLVGDTPTDVQAARNAGVPVIGVSFGYADTPMRELAPDATIDAFESLYDAVVAIAAGTAGRRAAVSA